MARIDRIVKRQSMREELAQLKAMISTTRVIIQAERQLRSAYQAGYAARLKEEIAEAKANETKQGVAVSEEISHEAVPVLNS